MEKLPVKYANTFSRWLRKTLTEDEKKYLWLVKKRIENGNLSDLIRERVLKKAQKTDFKEAIRQRLFNAY